MPRGADFGHDQPMSQSCLPNIVHSNNIIILEEIFFGLVSFCQHNNAYYGEIYLVQGILQLPWLTEYTVVLLLLSPFKI